MSERPLDQAAWIAGVVESSHDAIITTDLDSTITSWNPAAERIYGYAAAEAIGRSIRLILPPERSAEESDIQRRMLVGQIIEPYDSVRVRKDGVHIDVSISVSPLRARDGTLVGAVKIARDISERKRAEAERIRAEIATRRLAAIVESSDDAIIGMDLHGTITAWNEAAERLYGYTPAEAIGRSITMIVPQERQEEEAALLEQIKCGQRLTHSETTRCRRDGSCLTVSLTISPILDETGAVIGASKVARDITDRKRAAERAAFLAEAGAVLAASLEYVTTLKTVANLAVPSIADWCAVDVLTDDRRLDRLAVAHVDPTKIELARTIRNRYEDPTSPYSAPHVVRTGKPAWLPWINDDMIVTSARGDEERIALLRSLGLTSYIIVPLTAHGRTFGALTLATAGSGRVYSEEDFRFAQDVAFRAALAVDNARAYNEAQTANRLKDEFLATLSHELRTPLNAIVGYSRLLQTGMLNKDKRPKALMTVERNAAALTKIVEDILDVSRIISGKVRLNLQPVDLPQVVTAAVDTVLPAAEAKQIRVQTMLDPHAAPISGDPDRLQQIIWNLISNAVKFTPKKGIVQVRLERVNSHVEITVSDTGIGIPPEFLPHMFERFRQADSATTREYGGIGLGLAIARHLVELHGGTIHAFSGGRDQGATFRVTLPLMIVHANAVSERRARLRSETTGARSPLPQLKHLHVLAVDDDVDARALVSATLESAGARVTTVDSVAGALDTLATHRPDVLLADIGMAGADGYELIRRIRGSRERAIRDVPAAALTAYARVEDRMKSLQSGFQMHLPKPVDPAELIVAVAALAKQKPDRRG